MFSIKKISLSCFDENRWKKYFVYGYKKERINIPMKKLYCIECNTCRIFDKTLGLSIIWSNCGNNNNIIFQEESIEILKIHGLIDNIKWIFIVLNV